MLIFSKLFPCFSCCQKYSNKSSQIISDNAVEEEKKDLDKLEVTGEFKLNSSSFKDIKSGKKEDILDNSEEKAQPAIPSGSSRQMIKNKAYST